MSHNIVAEALINSTHSKGEHAKGSLIHDNATEILIDGSLYASKVDRNPLFKGGSRGAVVNNFIMNPKWYAITYGLVASEWGEQPYQMGMVSMVGNVFHHGLDRLAGGAFFRASGGPVDVFLQDNVAQDLVGNPVDWLCWKKSGNHGRTGFFEPFGSTCPGVSVSMRVGWARGRG